MTSWFTSTLQTVREKSFDALKFVRNDLSEFTTVVKTDAETYLNKIKSQPVGELGINRLVSRLNDVVVSNNNAGKHIHASSSCDRLHNEQSRLQNDESTYLTDPIPIENYETWRQVTNFNVDNRKGEIAQLLINAPRVRSFYARFVPACTTHGDFWSRYYFRLFQMNEEESKRLQLIKRAHEICNEKNSENEWDEPNDVWSQESINVAQQSVPIITTTIIERRENDSGDSWEREFDETDLDTSKTATIPSNHLPETVPIESSIIPTTVSSTKKTDKEFDDEWEAWS